MLLLLIFQILHLCSVDKAVEKVSTPEQSKQPEQDKVQRLTDRLADGVTDLSRTRPDQNSSNATEKGR